MTHDELLAKINDEISNCAGLMAGAILGDALIAVVELHKPKPVWGSMEDAECEECSWRKHQSQYPCPTIQAIERGLN